MDKKLVNIFCFILILANVPNSFSTLRINSTAPQEINSVTSSIIVNGSRLIAETNRIILELDLAKNGNIVSLKNTKTEQNLQLVSTSPLWTISLMDNSWYNPVNTISFNYSVTESRAILKYIIPHNKGPISIIFTIQVDNPHPGINLKLDVLSNLNHPGVFKVFTPYFEKIAGWSLTQGSESIVIPEREGWLIENAINSISSRGHSASYPGTLSMQFLLLSEKGVGGFFIGAFDSNSRHKGIEMFSNGFESIKIDFYHYSNNMNYHQGNNFTMDYWTVIDGYSGRTWANGADLYKDWALKQWYVDKGTVKERNDIPSWLKNIDYVWKGSSYVTNHNNGIIFLEGETVDKMGNFPIELATKGLSKNFLLEWWGWGRDGFDRGYPEYFPARDGNESLKSGINDVHSEGSYVLLYFNGRLVDITTSTYTNNTQFMTAFDDSIYTETYHPYFTGAIPDPSSNWWKSIVKNFSLSAVRDFDADVIFLDQISVAPPKFDYRNVSTHPPGSGSWWQIAENELLNLVRTAIREIKPDSVLSSENIIETYLQNVDIFWNYQTNYDFSNWFPNGFSIPLFSYIYHKYSMYSGRSDIYPGNLPSYAWAISEELKAGYIPGGATLSLPSKHQISTSAYSILKSAYETRKIGNFKFFRDGDLLSPIDWSSSPDLRISSGGTTREFKQGIIQAYSSQDNEIGLLIGNRGNSKLTFKESITDIYDSIYLNSSKFDPNNISMFTDGIYIDEISLDKISNGIEIPPYSFVFLRFKNGSNTQPSSTYETQPSSTYETQISLSNETQTQASIWDGFFAFTSILTIFIVRRIRRSYK